MRRLSKLSAEAVQNLDHFDPLKKYMHITRHTEIDFKQLLLKIAEATSDNIEKRDCDVLDFYAADDITPIVLSELNGSEYSHILHSIGLSAIDNGRDPLKKYVYKFLRNYKKLFLKTKTPARSH